MTRNNKNDSKVPSNTRKNPVFLVLGLITISATVAAYIYQDDIIYHTDSSEFAHAILLLLLVIITLFFMMCYRNPVIGNRVIGKAPDIEQSEKDKTGVHYTGFMKPDSASDEKKRSSKRKKSRSTRKHYAAATREMDTDKSTRDDSGK